MAKVHAQVGRLDKIEELLYCMQQFYTYKSVKRKKMKLRNYTYIIECKDGKFYTGWTNCIEKRIQSHNQGTGAKFTKGRGPVKLRYLEILETKSEAMKREAAIKKMTRKEKEQLILENDLAYLLKEYGICLAEKEDEIL